MKSLFRASISNEALFSLDLYLASGYRRMLVRRILVRPSRRRYKSQSEKTEDQETCFFTISS